MEFSRAAGYLVITVLVLGLMLGGCAEPPAEQQPDELSYSAEELAAIVQPFLPEGAELEKPEVHWPGDQPPAKTIPRVQFADLSGDGQAEIFAGYRLSDTNRGVLVLRSDGDGWNSAYQEENMGVGIDRLEAADITGDGRDELLIGLTIGASAGVGLKILTWDGEEFSELTQTAYHRLDVADLPGKNGTDGKMELATWTKDTGDAMAVEVWCWDGEKLIPAEDTYPAYFPQVVNYYLERVEREPGAKSYWYYLADAQLKSGHLEDALDSAGRGMALSQSYPEPELFQLLYGQALYELGRYQEAVDEYSNVLNEWDAGRTPKHQGTSWLRKTQAEILYQRGEAYLALGDEAGARADWEQASELYTDWNKPKQALENLE